jgi:hypothetical protein
MEPAREVMDGVLRSVVDEGLNRSDRSIWPPLMFMHSKGGRISGGGSETAPVGSNGLPTFA